MKTDINNTDLIRFYRAVIEDRESKGLSCFNYDNALRHVISFAGKEIPFCKINSDWLDSLRQFLLKSKGFRCEKQLSTSTANTYHKIILNILKTAVASRLLDATVLHNVKLIERSTRKSECLSSSELQALAEAECDCNKVKRSYLLSALTGLQWNEVVSITWKHVEKTSGHNYMLNLTEFDNPRVIPLNQQAYTLLGNDVRTTQPIFTGLKWNSYLYIKLNKWAIRAGIHRNITFQSARVTFAVQLRSNGTPAEIIAELLGHRELKSTLRLLNA